MKKLTKAQIDFALGRKEGTMKKELTKAQIKFALERLDTLRRRKYREIQQARNARMDARSTPSELEALAKQKPSYVKVNRWNGIVEVTKHYMDPRSYKDFEDRFKALDEAYEAAQEELLLGDAQEVLDILRRFVEATK